VRWAFAPPDRRRFADRGAPEVDAFGPEGISVFGRLFRRSLTREQAIAIATGFLVAHGCSTAAPEREADLTGAAIPVVFRHASMPGRRWHVRFERVLPPGLWCSHTDVDVDVWSDNGKATFDPFEGRG
jgi:hypothetical protein